MYNAHSSLIFFENLANQSDRPKKNWKRKRDNSDVLMRELGWNI